MRRPLAGLRLPWGLAAAIGLLALLSAAVRQAPPVRADGPRPVIGTPVSPASFDGDVRRLPPPTPVSPPRAVPPPLPVRPGIRIQAEVDDPVRQGWQGPGAMPTPIRNFKGLSFMSFPYANMWPPDANGDVGPGYYIQAVNTAVGIFSKDGLLLAAFTFADLFSGKTGTPCDGGFQGDPIVLYDPLADRWLVTYFAYYYPPSPPFYECIAVSKTGDPISGGWWLYALLADNQYLNDYPKLGVWPDAIYMSANMGGDFGFPRVWALNRDDLYRGAPLRYVYFDVPCWYYPKPCPFSTLLPANLRGSPPPRGSPNFFLSLVRGNSYYLSLWKFHVDWLSPANSTFVLSAYLPVAPYNMPCDYCVPELGGDQWLESLGDRLMMQLQYRNIRGVESLWANHTVSVNGVTGIRWYEIRNPNGSPVVYQQGTFLPDSNYRWMGSLAVDRDGNMAVGYSVSGPTMYPSIRYAGRLAGDPPGTLGQAETTLVAGTGSQSVSDQSLKGRWGDYSAMTVDPVDDCTFWYTNQYYEATGQFWVTRIGAFKFPTCGTAPTPTATPSPTPTPTPASYRLYLPLLVKEAPW